MNILQVNASILQQASRSTELADLIVKRLIAREAAQGRPAARLAVRDLGQQPPPMLDAAALAALGTAPEARTAEQTRRVALDDALIAEIQAADSVVLAVPMYNFGIPAQLKNWFDAIARARVTFRYTEEGPEGLLKNKQVYVVLTRGGRYRDTADDSQLPYLKTILGFLGMTDLAFFHAEGLSISPEAAEQALAQARQDIAAALS